MRLNQTQTMASTALTKTNRGGWFNWGSGSKNNKKTLVSAFQTPAPIKKPEPKKKEAVIPQTRNQQLDEIYTEEDFELYDSVVTANAATAGGGGLSLSGNYSSLVSITGSSIEGNATPGSGGGIRTSRSALVMETRLL